MLLNDFIELPWVSLRRIASTTFVSIFVSGIHAFWGEPAFPTAPPILN